MARLRGVGRYGILLCLCKDGRGKAALLLPEEFMVRSRGKRTNEKERKDEKTSHRMT